MAHSNEVLALKLAVMQQGFVDTAATVDKPSHQPQTPFHDVFDHRPSLFDSEHL